MLLCGHYCHAWGPAIPMTVSPGPTRHQQDQQNRRFEKAKTNTHQGR